MPTAIPDQVFEATPPVYTTEHTVITEVPAAPAPEPVMVTYPLPAVEPTPAPDPVLTTHSTRGTVSINYHMPAVEQTQAPDPVLTTYSTRGTVSINYHMPAVEQTQAITERPAVTDASSFSGTTVLTVDKKHRWDKH